MQALEQDQWLHFTPLAIFVDRSAKVHFSPKGFTIFYYRKILELTKEQDIGDFPHVIYVDTLGALHMDVHELSASLLAWSFTQEDPQELAMELLELQSFSLLLQAQQEGMDLQGPLSSRDTV